MQTIQTHLQKHWPDVAACYDAETLQLIDAFYQEPQRGYHGSGHIIDLLDKLTTYRSGADTPALIAHAILWHDAVYRTSDLAADGTVTPRADALNVEDSAKLFEKSSVLLTPDEKIKVSAMIRATAGHQLSLPADHAQYRDTALFLDLDLSVLALPYAAFTRAAHDIRKEYPHVTQHDFCLGRAAFLDLYAQKSPLFFHPATKELFEATARDNMQRQAEDYAARPRN